MNSAIVKEIGFYLNTHNWLLMAISFIILAFEGWILYEGAGVFIRNSRQPAIAREM